MTPNETNTINNVAPEAEVKTTQQPQQAAKGNPYRNLALALAIVAGLAAFIFYGIHSRASADAHQNMPRGN